MVQSQGKMNKKVNTLLTTEMVSAIDLLIQKRGDCGLADTNVYIFANQGEGHLDTWQTLRKVAQDARCQNPELISSNALRKYISTVCQVCKFYVLAILSCIFIVAEAKKFIIRYFHQIIDYIYFQHF